MHQEHGEPGTQCHRDFLSISYLYSGPPPIFVRPRARVQMETQIPMSKYHRVIDQTYKLLKKIYSDHPTWKGRFELEFSDSFKFCFRTWQHREGWPLACGLPPSLPTSGFAPDHKWSHMHECGHPNLYTQVPSTQSPTRFPKQLPPGHPSGLGL